MARTKSGSVDRGALGGGSILIKQKITSEPHAKTSEKKGEKEQHGRGVWGGRGSSRTTGRSPGGAPRRSCHAKEEKTVFI